MKMEVSAKPIEWEVEGEDPPTEWGESQYGFWISLFQDGDSLPYQVTWGEDDIGSFATLREAMAHCQTTIDKWVKEHCVVVFNDDAV